MIGAYESLRLVQNSDVHLNIDTFTSNTMHKKLSIMNTFLYIF